MFFLSVFSFNTHRFVAPVRGLYWFTLSIRTNDTGDSKILMRMNRDTTAKARCQDYDGSAVSKIVMLEAGDCMDGLCERNRRGCSF